MTPKSIVYKGKPDTRLKLLEQFYLDVINLTVDHEVIGESAVVFPSDLGNALEKVDPRWYDNMRVSRKKNS